MNDPYSESVSLHYTMTGGTKDSSTSLFGSEATSPFSVADATAGDAFWNPVLHEEPRIASGESENNHVISKPQTGFVSRDLGGSMGSGSGVYAGVSVNASVSSDISMNGPAAIVSEMQESLPFDSGMNMGPQLNDLSGPIFNSWKHEYVSQVPMMEGRVDMQHFQGRTMSVDGLYFHPEWSASAAMYNGVNPVHHHMSVSAPATATSAYFSEQWSNQLPLDSIFPSEMAAAVAGPEERREGSGQSMTPQPRVDYDAQSRQSFEASSADISYQSRMDSATKYGLPTPPTSGRSRSHRLKSYPPGKVSKSQIQIAAPTNAANFERSPNAPIYKYMTQARLSMQSGTTKLKVKNKSQWLTLSKMTDSRKNKILDVLKKKNIANETAFQVFELFPQKNVSKKLEILAVEFGRYYAKLHNTLEELKHIESNDIEKLNRFLWLDQSQERSESQLKQFPRCIVKDSLNQEDEPFSIQVRTSSGYNDFSEDISQDDLNLLKLRHMPLLRESDDRKRKTRYYEFIEGKMKRPLNSFMLYRSAVMKSLAILKIVKSVSELMADVNCKYPSWDESTCLNNILLTVRNRAGKVPPGEMLLGPSELNTISALIEDNLYEKTRNPSSYTRKPIEPVFSNHTVLAYVITTMWNTETENVRGQFVSFSKKEKEHHQLVYPKYKYTPVKKFKVDDAKV